ncbi:MAG: GNAT family N-acetyltransferase [Candidatus Erginobacter occultus]|nr:GNAT family N-acetyltransferase [Candidatus Erginobacter occultus]
MNLKLEAIRYPRYLEEQHYRLFQEAWEKYFASGGQAKLSVDTLRNLYENNPGGSAFIGVARDGDIWAGSLAAIPFRIQLGEKKVITAYQISDAIVSPRYQRRSIMSSLVGILTEKLGSLPASVIYTFPNLRSRNAFIKNGYLSRNVLPTRFYFPSPTYCCFRLNSHKQSYRRFNRPIARYREIGHDEAAELTTGRDTVLPRLVRDGEYLKWRYFQPTAEDRFRLWAIEPAASPKPLVAITTCHRYSKGKFTVFLELLPQTGKDNPRWLAGMLTALGRRNGCGILYSNEKIGGGLLSPTWELPLPDRFNPRPIELLIYPQPGNGELEKAFLSTQFTTADWLGFL